MLIAFIFLVVFFLLLVEILCVLFRLTGLSEDKARFQVISILTGTGYTTKESELITQHLVRRKIAQWVMLLGYAGSITFTSIIINILIDVVERTINMNELLISVGAALILLLVLQDKRIIIFIDAIIEKTILKRKNNTYKSMHKIYILLNNNKGYGIYNILIEENSEFIGKTLQQSGLKEKYNIQVLSIDKGNEIINSPNGNYSIQKEDNLLVYGRIREIKNKFHI